MALSNGPFTVKLVDNKEQDILMKNDVFYLNDKQEYAVCVTNKDSSLRADAIIYIDGKNMGRFRLETNRTITIERPADDDKARKFTFLKIDSVEGKAAKVDKGPSPGELKVIIQQEKPSPVYHVYSSSSRICIDGARPLGFSGRDVPDFNDSGEDVSLGMEEFDCVETDCAISFGGGRGTPASLSSSRRATGGTALGSESTQQFRRASEITTSQEFTLLGHMQLKEEYIEL
jgi:hypothetical protein